MPLALVALLATAPAAAAAVPVAQHTRTASTTVARCSWDQPGDKPFMGDLVAAVDRYRDIPAPVRARLQARMANRAYDEIVSIGRDAISGNALYRPEIRDMHFGSGQVCATVNRAQWARNAQERGLVYCEASHCILVPTVCRNVSRISRIGGSTRTGSGPDGGVAAAGGVGGAVPGAVPGAAPAGLAGAPGLAERTDGSPAAASGAVVDGQAGGLPGGLSDGLSGGPALGPADGPADGPFAALPAGQISANTAVVDPVGALAGAIAPVDGGLGALLGTSGAGAGAGGVVGAAAAYAGGSVALGGGSLIDAPTPAVPEPGNRLLLLSGLLALGGWAYRRAGRAGRTARPSASVQRDLGAHRAGAVGAGGQGNAGAALGDHHPLGHGPVCGDLTVGQKRLQ